VLPARVEPPATRRQQARRVGLAALVHLLFIDLNDGAWVPDPPDVDEAEAAMLAVAGGQVNEEWLAGWLRDRIRF